MKKVDLRLLTDIAFLVGAGASVYYMLNLIFRPVELGGRPLSKDDQKRATASLRRLRREDPDRELVLDEYENAMLANVIGPDEIQVGFASIGGLNSIVDEIREAVLFPLLHPEIQAISPLARPPKGVLLHGPPGCGKTLLAKALARESGANFLNINVSSITDKWYGESNKQVAAIFSLATKLQPCIIFLDEIDSLLRERSSSDHEASAMVKAELMTWWDGLTSKSRILVVGATNRPHDIDKAFLRRMPKHFAVPLPGDNERRAILQILLKGTQLDPHDFDLDLVVKRTSGFSGSDLEELCRNAAMAPVREHIRAQVRGDPPTTVRSVATSDFFSDEPRIQDVDS